MKKHTYYKSVTKHIRKGHCRAINNFRATRDSTILACESNVGKEVDRHIVTKDQSPTGVRKVGGANVVTNQNSPGFMEESPDNRPAKENVGKQNILGKYQSDNYTCPQCKKKFKIWDSMWKHMDTTMCSAHPLTFQHKGDEAGRGTRIGHLVTKNESHISELSVKMWSS